MTVTVCGVFQLAAVNVTLAGETVPSRRVAGRQADRHVRRGLRVQHDVNVAVPPASVVIRPLVGLTVIPAVSSSVLVTDTSAAFRPL